MSKSLRKKRVVVVGGGAGIFPILRGLKEYDYDISAIVTTFDSGGSTGILRDEYGALPAGDVRRALVALAPENGDQFLRKLFSFRFEGNQKSGINGHSIGNFLLYAASKVSGSDLLGIRSLEQLLQIRGSVYPVSSSTADLCAILENGEKIIGETNIDIPKHDKSLFIKRVYLEPKVRILPAARQAILEAHTVIIGPGDLYSSLVPNLLVSGFRDALCRSRAKKICIVNLVGKPGETEGFSASHFVEELLSYSDLKSFDLILCSKISRRPIAYTSENKHPMLIDLKNLKQLSRRVVVANLLVQGKLLRHDAKKTARLLSRYI